MSDDEVLKVEEVTQDSKNMALLSWLGTLFFGFVPGLILYLVTTDDQFVQDQSKESLNWAITVMIASMIAFVLSFVVIGILLIPVIGICHLVFCVMGAVATSKGNSFRVPYAIRLIK